MRRVLTQTDAPVNSGRRVAFSGEMTAAIAAGLLGSVALFPLVALQGPPPAGGFHVCRP
jgi:hypothetical protein